VTLSCIVLSASGLLGMALGVDGWIEARLPVRLLQKGPWEVPTWKWLLLPLGLLFAWALGYLLSRITRGILTRIALGTENQWDDAILTCIGAPMTLAWMLLPMYSLLAWLGLHGARSALIQRLLRAGLLFALFWALSRAMDVVLRALVQSPWAKTHPAAQSLLPLAARLTKIAVWALGAVALLSELGYPVASLVAGLGIGGLALALAAQKTVENLFGAFSIGADQPFREGDFVKVEDFVGTVESIGLRSTKIRTLDRTLITVPNGKLAEMRLESYAARDRMRLACNVGLVYETTAAQLREILSELERVLRAHPKIWPDAVVVRFKDLGESSLNIEVMAWFQTPDFSEFQLIRQEVLLQFMEVVKKAGSSFAFPTRTVHLINEAAGRDSPSAGS
jgi:MscS family membrane protein